MIPTFYTVTDTPVGKLLLVSQDGKLKRVEFHGGEDILAAAQNWRPARAPFTETIRQLEQYFAGRLRAFKLPLAPEGTPFQRATWNALLTIPYGETRSYAQIARTMGTPTAVRAVGAANGRNPLPIVIPCHRVIGSNGDLTGFGGGLDIKRKLLELEGSLSQNLWSHP
jgi:methylated-DNA-[protein]-cysteine S-methyltransferase